MLLHCLAACHEITRQIYIRESNATIFILQTVKKFEIHADNPLVASGPPATTCAVSVFSADRYMWASEIYLHMHESTICYAVLLHFPVYPPQKRWYPQASSYRLSSCDLNISHGHCVVLYFQYNTAL